MHTPTRIQRSVFQRIEKTEKQLIDIIDNPTHKVLEEIKSRHENSEKDYSYEMVSESGKKVLLVWMEE